MAYFLLNYIQRILFFTITRTVLCSYGKTQEDSYMMKAKTTAFILALLLMGGAAAFTASDTAAHDVTMQVIEVVLIDLNSTAAITLTTNAPAAGGDPVTGDTDATKLLQYTSLVGAAVTRNITANWGAADAAQINLSNVGVNIITGIGSCATGVGVNGAELTFTFSVDTVGSLVVGDNQTVTVTYTLTDAS